MTPNRGNSIEGLRRSTEIERPISRGIEGLESANGGSEPVEIDQAPPPVPRKGEDEGNDHILLPVKPNTGSIVGEVDIVSPIPTRLSSSISPLTEGSANGSSISKPDETLDTGVVKEDMVEEEGSRITTEEVDVGDEQKTSHVTLSGDDKEIKGIEETVPKEQGEKVI